MKPFGWYRALMRNPRYRWLVILGSLIYLLSPIDLSPDVFPLIGQIDDVIIVTLLFSEVFQRLIGGTLPDGDDDQFGAKDERRSYEQTDSKVKTVDVKAVSIDDSNSQVR